MPIFLLSLLLAFSIWLFYNLSLSHQEFLSVPVVASCNIEGHSAVSANTCEVAARCRTSGYTIVGIKSLRSKPVTIPFTKMYPAGGEMYYVTVSELQEFTPLLFGEHTSLEYYLTDTLYFRFPYETYKKVAVRASHELDFRPQYTIVGDLTVTPDSVTVYGEPYRLEKIDYVYTEPIKATKLDSDLHGVAKLKKIKEIRFSDESVRYSAIVERYVEISETVPVQVRNVPKGKNIMVYPSSAKVSFKCRFPYKVNPADSTVFYVDYNDYAASRSGKCMVRLDGLPSDVISYTVTPEVFECVANDR